MKSKASNSEILTYLQERKKSLKKELEQVEKVLNSIDVDEKPSKPSNRKGKKKSKKKLEKAVKAIRKKVSEAIEGVKSVAKSTAAESGSAQVAPEAVKRRRSRSRKAATAVPETVGAPEAKKEPISIRRARKPRVADNPANASAVTTVPAVVAEEKKPVRRKAAAKKTVEPKAADEPALAPNGTMDEKIRYALGQKRSTTKEELIEYLNALEPDYGLSKLRKVVAFRLNHLVKTGKIKAKESKAGIRYAN